MFDQAECGLMRSMVTKEVADVIQFLWKRMLDQVNDRDTEGVI